MAKFCRTCLQGISDLGYISLLDAEKAEEIKQKFNVCVPELSLDLATVTETVFCFRCIEALNGAYEFRNRCLQTEEHIKTYIENLILKSKVIDLGEVNQQAEDVMEIEIKKEPLEEQSEVETQINIVNNGNCAREETSLQKESEGDEAVVQDNEALVSNEPVVFDQPNEDEQQSTNAVSNVETESIYKRGQDTLVEYSCKQKDALTLQLKKQREVKVYSCPKCTYTSETLNYLRRHIMFDHLGYKPLKCENCTFRTGSRDALDVHLLMHTVKRYKCKMCTFSSKKREAVVEHAGSHSTLNG